MKTKKTSLAFLALFLTLIPFSLLFAATIIDDDATDFGNGTHTGTQWDGGNSWLEINSSYLWTFPDSGSTAGWFNMSNNKLLMHLDESSGTIADTSGNGYNGTYNGALYSQTGRLNTAIGFDGSDDGVTTSLNIDQSSSANNVTMMAWVYPASVSGGRHHVFSTDNGGYDWSLLREGATWFVFWGNGSNSAGFSVDTNQWQHVAVVFDRTNSQTVFYKNGVKSVIAAIDYDTSDSNVAVGKSPSFGEYFDGRIDEAVIWDKALTDEEVYNIYLRQAGQYGYFTSRVFNATGSTVWNTIGWTPQMPLYKELPNSLGIETAYNAGNIDMTGNVLLYHMNESSGAITDSSGQGNNGTYNGALYSQQGKFNTAIGFDGADDYIEVLDSADPTVYTISAWVKADQIRSQAIFTRTDASGPGISHSHELRMTADGAFQHYTVDSIQRLVTGSTIASINQWYHIVATAQNGGSMRLYVNGAEEGTAISGLGTLWTGGDRYNIGRDTAQTTYNFDGTLDEVVIWFRALSDTEILDAYKRGATRIKYHVRSCNDSACSGETFIGPDGTTATYYSELSNTGLGLPSLSLTNVPDNQYFQYRAFLESDSASYSPELKSLTADYDLLGESLDTTAGISNAAPVITAVVSDGGSSITTPTANGANVSFSTTASDINGDHYYFIVCDSESVTPGVSDAPTCGGNQWAVSASTLSGSPATATYQVGSSTETSCSGTLKITCPWHAFVCEERASASCFPATDSSDQGQAIGTITFSGVPADGDYITVDSIVYEFDRSLPYDCGGGASQDVCLNTSSDHAGGDTAANLAANETGGGSYMAARAGVVYVYASAVGSGGESIAMSEGQDTNNKILLSGSNLVYGSNDNATPFVYSANITIDAVTIGDTSGGGGQNPATGTIEPGDTVYINAAIGATVDVDMYACSTDSFTYGASPACGGTEICHVSGVDASTDYAECSSLSVAAVPTAHGSYNVYVFAQTSLAYGEDDSANNGPHSYSVADVAPELISYTATESPSPSAGGSHDVDFYVTLSDDNGDTDVTSVAGVLFDKNATTNACSADRQDCYIDSSCAITTGDADEELTAQCTVTFWYNGNASDWDVQAEAVDDLGTEELADANVSLNNPALSGLNISQASIDYSSIVAGYASAGKTTTVQNVGNQVLDIYLDGDAMACAANAACIANPISVGQQKWHHSSNDFFWDAAATAPGPYTLVDTASGDGDETGCLNRDIPVKIDTGGGSGDGTEEENIYWILKIPESQPAGTYTGSNTFSAASQGTCGSGQSY